MVNRVTLVGRLGHDPELKATNSGKSVVTLDVATTEKWANEEHTEWHKVIVWGNTANACAQYLTKGKLVYVEGSIRSRTWETKDGAKRTAYEIQAMHVKFLSARNEPAESEYSERAREEMAKNGKAKSGQADGFSDDDEPPF